MPRAARGSAATGEGFARRYGRRRRGLGWRGPFWTHATAQAIGQAFDKGPIHVHHVNVFLAGAVGTEHDEIAVGADKGVFIITLSLGKSIDMRAIRVHGENIEVTLNLTRERDLIILR